MQSRFSSEIKFFEDPDDVSSERLTFPDLYNLFSNNTSLSQSVDTSSKFEISNKIAYPKKEFKKLTWDQNSYEGTILADNLHGPGFYFHQKDGQKYFYDGMFYMNKLEGYCQIFYEHGTHFQGLFKEHLRYGPGVLSYPNGSQDVGFWNGFKLLRLACVVGNDTVPTLASTQSGKVQLICNRSMVPFGNETTDIGKLILENIGANREVLAHSDSIYNLNIRNPRSLFFNKKFYDEQFFNGLDCTIKVLLDTKDDADSLIEDEFKKQQNVGPFERKESLRSKIDEVNESLQAFVAIRQNLFQQVDKCRKCCESVLPETSEGVSDVSEVSKKIPDKASPELAFFDASLGSGLNISNFDEEVESPEECFSSTSTNIKENSLVDICICDEEEIMGDLQSLEEQLQNITTQETYYRNIRDELQKKLDLIEENESHSPRNYKFKLVKINELWAWNNEESLIQMQRHCFRHRSSEDMVNFSVPNLILGNRKEFGPPGQHETLCRQFLLACSKGNKKNVKEWLKENKVSPNLVDARGNSGVFFAAAKNQQDMISTLTNFGAKLDQFNDEQLTPLSMSVLKYLAVKNNCMDWEKTFLPETKVINIPDLPKWYEVKSFLSITSESSKNSIYPDQEDSRQCTSNPRIIDLFKRVSTFEQKKGSFVRPPCNSYIFNIECKTSKSTEYSINSDLQSELRRIYLTIMTLLEYGANPNLCEVPYPPLVLSLFTENPDLVKEIIKANADINILIDENLSCLHVAASLNPCRANANILRLLAKYGCNPKVKTLPGHWADRRPSFTGNLPEMFEIEDFGKNALHLLCMRTDFEEDQSDYFCLVAKILLDTNLDIKETYLGHTPLSLAVLSGNITLVQCLIKTNVFNPYHTLEYGMGNILTLYLLRRFDKILPTDQCKAMLTVLFNMDVNVLHKVNDYENAIAFAEDADNYFDQFIQKDTNKVVKTKGKTKPKKVEKSAQAAALKEFVRSLGRQTIIKQVQIVVTEFFYEFVEEDMLNDYEILVTLANEYMTPQIAIQNLQHLFETKKIEPDRLELKTVKTLLEFVNSNKKIVKKPVPKSKSKIKKEQTQEVVGDPDDIDAMARTFDLTLNLQFVPPLFLHIPGLDNSINYKICFHCLRGKDKDLKSCPRCQMVQFCSAQCNKLNIKLKTQHGCNILFYDNMTDDEIFQISKGVCLNKLVQVAKEKCSDRMQRLRESRLNQEEEKLMKMWRADTYGTRFLQMKPLLANAVTQRRDKQLNWNLGLLKGILERQFRKFPGDNSFYSLEHLLIKLQAKKRSEGTIRTRISCSTRRSTLCGSILPSVNLEDFFEVQEETFPTCKCAEKAHHIKPKTKDKSNLKKKQETKTQFQQPLTGYITDEQTDQFQDLAGKHPVHEKVLSTTKKLQKMPTRYKRFIEVIGTYFPEIDLSFWLLPYACCSDGQLYYQFSKGELFKESYSVS